MVKNRPACTRNWKKNITRPPVNCRLPNIASRTSGSPPAPDDAVLPAGEQPEHEQAGEDQHDRRRQAEDRRGRPASAAPSPTRSSAARRTPPARARRPTATAPTTSSCAVLLDGRVLDPAGEDQDHEHDQDLAGEDPAPGEVRRRDAADQRSDGHGDGARRHDQAVGARATRHRDVAGDQGDDGRQDQGRADALEERPAEDQHRQVRRQRGREGAQHRRSRSRSRRRACARSASRSSRRGSSASP